ncbi:hypothetical protein O9G_002890 [Rozella allomycis CSF55]|uniref:GRIP domain-containing protein n=1 Tax=Rozella allomycis (strain CSF55) TaxID=988480 RepID=A0A075B4Q6_ROZAC|nr:hypothetical protein O9G_002890 [Rozella allomycis CSF55]|eukprot:EPZ36389.1 hypothetical protein O9G_002890 [Rozella allomycis CSF55]
MEVDQEAVWKKEKIILLQTIKKYKMMIGENHINKNRVDIEKEDEIFSLNEQLKDLRLQFIKNSNELKICEKRLEDEQKLNKTKEDKEMVQKNLERVQAEKELLENTNAMLSTRVAALEEENSHHKENRELHENYKQQLIDQEKYFNLKIDDLQSRMSLTEIRKEYELHRKKVSIGERTNATRKILELSNEIYNLEDKNKKLELDLTKESTEKKVVIGELDSLKTILNLKTQEINDLTKQIGEAEEKNNELLKLKEELERERSEKRLLSIDKEESTRNLKAFYEELIEKNNMQLEMKNREIVEIKEELMKKNQMQEKIEIAKQINMLNKNELFQPLYKGDSILFSRESIDVNETPRPKRGSESQIKTNYFKNAELMYELDELKRTRGEYEEKNKAMEETIDRLNNHIDQLNERISKREQVNVEYLKNVVFKFLKDENRQKLLPVMKTLLNLTPKEEEEIKEIVNRGSGLFLF